jgi:uncharacterized membrane protein YqiK
MQAFQSILSYVALIGGGILLLAILGFIGLKFYTLASKEKAFVRTGAGSQKVVLNGGAFVVPGIHEIVEVNMKTLRLDVEKKDKESLITADRLRVDVKVEFYVRVKADEASVANAAQTLGNLTLTPTALKNQVEAKFVDALRAVAVRMKMYDLNAERSKFVQDVRQVVAEDIAKNGLELESVSLTALNQTRKEHFDPSNAFDAEGLLVLTRETEQRRKSVNDIEQDTAVQIETKNLETERQQQSLRKQTEDVRLATAQEIATLTASQQATTLANEAESRRQAESARIEADQRVEQSRIEANRVTQEARVAAEAAVTIRGQEQNILVANKSQEEAAAQASADKARAIATAAEESVETARQVEVANRKKQVTLVSAEEKAKELAIAVVVAAEADKEAAENRAEAVRVDATGYKDAAVLRAEATIAEGDAVAQALSRKNTALNELSAEQVAMQIRLAVLAALPSIVEQSVKPLMNIDSIRIAEVGGLTGAGSAGSGTRGTQAGGAGGGGSLSDQVVNSALAFRTQAPLVDGLLQEVGLSGGGDLTKLLAGAAAVGMGGSDAFTTPAAASVGTESASPEAPSAA